MKAEQRLSFRSRLLAWLLPQDFAEHVARLVAAELKADRDRRDAIKSSVA